MKGKAPSPLWGHRGYAWGHNLNTSNTESTSCKVTRKYYSETELTENTAEVVKLILDTKLNVFAGERKGSFLTFSYRVVRTGNNLLQERDRTTCLSHEG